MSEPVVLTRYECSVHASNRHAGLGTPVTVFATSKQEAVDRAIAVGWLGAVHYARVTVLKIEQIVVSKEGGDE